MAEFNDRLLALQYIKERGYASHSSLKRYINGEAPSTWSSTAQIFGKELHSRFLEKKRLEKMGPGEEMLCKSMVQALELNKIVQRLMVNVRVEVEFKVPILGVSMLGYYDILGKKYVGDLKSTKQTTMKGFVTSLDFLQPAIYLRATGFKDFYFIGITKEIRPQVFVFNVRDYPALLYDADQMLCKWLKILKKDLKQL